MAGINEEYRCNVKDLAELGVGSNGGKGNNGEIPLKAFSSRRWFENWIPCVKILFYFLFNNPLFNKLNPFSCVQLLIESYPNFFFFSFFLF